MPVDNDENDIVHKKCQHQKVFSDRVLMSNPPQYPWICSICGERGTDRGTYNNLESYDDIIKRFGKRDKDAY